MEHVRSQEHRASTEVAGSVPGVSSVLHVITCLDVGGAERALEKLLRADTSARSRHSVVSLRDIGPVGRSLQDAGITVHALNMNPARVNVGAFVRLVRLISRSKPSVIQTWMYHADLFGGLAARCAGRRELVWGIRNTGFAKEASKVTIAIMRVCAMLSSWVPRVIVCCAQAARDSHVAWGYDAARMRVIPNGFELPDLSERARWRHELRAQFEVPETSPIIGMVARFDPLKDHHGFVRAAAGVACAHPDARFLLVGRGIDHGNRQLAQWIQQSGCADRFLLLGEQHDVNRCFAAMDVLCLSSIKEAFPNVVGEAMAMGLPCVVTDAGDAARIVGEAGWVVPPADPVQLGAALCKVLALGTAERYAAGAAARRRVQSEFSIVATRRKFEDAYLAALGSKGS